jgi:2-polyprenyl-6-methoxyphenol hydroxylase-like FAD-dependent oxidoreductase
VLKAPQSPQDIDQSFVYQVCVSGMTDKEPFRSITQRDARARNEERLAMIRTIALDLAEPFRSFLLLVPDDAKVKQLDLDDWSLPRESPAASTYTLVGDAAHAMTMCTFSTLYSLVQILTVHAVLGAGANHAIVDVLELKRMILSNFGPSVSKRTDVEAYQRSVATRTLPTVLASRQACLEAHDWANLTSTSQLLSARQMVVGSDD